MAEERVFSEQEVEQILRRAVEITEAAASEPPYQPGVTQSELEKIAAEVGVSPEALTRAILEAGQRTAKRGPLHLTEEFVRVVEGELDPSLFDTIAEQVKTFGASNRPPMTQVGRTLKMSVWNGIGQATIDVTSRSGRTKLSVKSNALFQGLMTLHPALIASLISIAALSERGMGWLGAAIATAAMTIGCTLFATLTKIGHRRSEKLADDLRDRIAATVSDQKPVSTPAIEEQVRLEHRIGPG